MSVARPGGCCPLRAGSGTAGSRPLPRPGCLPNGPRLGFPGKLAHQPRPFSHCPAQPAGQAGRLLWAVICISRLPATGRFLAFPGWCMVHLCGCVAMSVGASLCPLPFPSVGSRLWLATRLASDTPPGPVIEPTGPEAYYPTLPPARGVKPRPEVAGCGPL